MDLERDPGERVDVSAGHPEVVVAHRARIEALSQSLAAPGEFDYKLDPVLRERLRILGYVVPD